MILKERCRAEIMRAFLLALGPNERHAPVAKPLAFCGLFTADERHDAMREAILTNCSKSQVLGNLYGRLSIVLVRANTRAILARSLQVADMQVDAMDY
ncbi:hypothetical protein EMCRGX_G010891 [Ephydatia muelleri]